MQSDNQTSITESEAAGVESTLSEEEEGREDLSSFLTEDSLEDSIASFLSGDNDNQPDFTSDENQTEDLSSFLTEDNLNEDVSSFLIEENQAEDLSDFLLEETEQKDDSLAVFLDEESLEKNTAELELNPSTEMFVLPDEEYDQELFSIFIQQVREKFSVLKKCIEKLAFFDEKIEPLNAAIDALESLKFSANYMAYEKLTHFYAKWIDDIIDAQEELLSPVSQMSFEFMNDYMVKLQAIIPQLQNTVSLGIEDAESALLTDAIDKLAVDNVESAIESAFIAEVIQSQPAVLPEPPVAEKTVIQTAPEAINQSTVEDESEDDDLFKRLSGALDSSIEQSITSEPINELFGALLATNKEEQARAKAEKEHELRLEIKTLEQANKEPSLQSVETITKQIKSVAQTETVKSKTTITAEKDDAGIRSAKKSKLEVSTDKTFKKSIRVDADKIDSLMNQVGELIVDRAYFFQLASEINELQQYLKTVTGLGQKDLKPVRTFAYRFSEAVISLGRTSNELQEGVMKVRMLPIAQIFNRYPRLVHDLAHTNGKKVQLEIRGEETELDKMIIEEISDPLIHMIRNAIGHGIEVPDVRKKEGKPETGTLILEAYHESNHIVIEVTDDGRGIDTDRIKAKAEEMNLFSKEELNRMSKDDLTRFIMMPGFSTAREINSTSGRGVGMDVVKKNIEKLNGTIEVESKLGVETKIRLKIPLTLAIIQALLVRVGQDSFTIPLANVEETLRVSEFEISIMEETEVMYLRGKTLPIFRLATLFGLKSSQQATETDFFVVVVNTGNQRIGLMVDALIGQEEVVIKPLADYLHEQNCFSGATIIGDGRISLILDVYELINMTTDRQIKKHHDQEKKSLASLAE